MIKHIFFDCMETLVEVETIRGDRDYARLAYYGSGLKDELGDFETFLKKYLKAKQKDIDSVESGRETSMYSRFSYMFDHPSEQAELDEIYVNYCKNYYSECNIYPDVVESLKSLSKKYKLVIVSNFKMEKGIETILDKLGITDYFDHIVSSIDVGWRKPHSEFYECALEKSGAVKDEVLFIGDDVENDYYGAKKFGFNAILLDRYDKNREIKDRINTLMDLKL